MSTDSDLASVKKRRAIIKSACTRIKMYVESITSLSPATSSQLEERKLKLEQHWNEYDKLQTQLEIMDDSEAGDRVGFEEAYYHLAAKIRDLLRPPGYIA